MSTKPPRDLQVLTVAQIIHLHHTLRGDFVPYPEHVSCCETSRAIIAAFGPDAARAALKSYKRQDYTYGLYSYQSDEARAAQAAAAKEGAALMELFDNVTEEEPTR